MNIKLLVVSKTDTPYLQEGIDLYVKRLRRKYRIQTKRSPFQTSALHV